MAIAKIILNGVVQMDVTQDTVAANNLLSGETATGADGNTVTGAYVPSGGGLVYETGTWTPSENVANYVISFNNTHTEAPIYYNIVDQSDSYSDATYSNYSIAYFNFHQLFGAPFYINGSGSYVYGIATTLYRSTSGTALTGAAPTQITYPYTDTLSNSNLYSRYWATETGIRAYTNSTSRYWRAGRTYKWIAVWKPTT